MAKDTDSNVDLAEEAKKLRREAEELRQDREDSDTPERAEKLAREVDSSVESLRKIADRLR